MAVVSIDDIRYLMPKEAARVVGVSGQTILNWISWGWLRLYENPVLQYGRVDVEELYTLLDLRERARRMKKRKKKIVPSKTPYKRNNGKKKRRSRARGPDNSIRQKVRELSRRSRIAKVL